FDPAQLAFKAAALGADAHGAVLQLNASQAPQGRLGVAMAIPASGLFQQGERQILVLSLEARSSVGLSSQLSFGDQPVVRDISDVNAQGLAAGFTPLVITVPPFGPRLGFSFSNGTLVLYWSTQASGFHLETSSGSPGGSWTPFSGAPVVIGDQNVVPVGTTGAPAYFRLSRP
ncbi:MAG TPA: hypothetical protein PKW90_29620, partial [Myxococcota bacterium]|nr:hypothetical protein [Myxococcota bacterium]